MDVSQIQAAARQPGLLNLVGSTSSNGLGLGSRLSVPSGMGAVILLRGQPLDLLGPGDYAIDAATCPMLGQQTAAVSASQSMGVDISVVVMPIDAVTLPWSAVAIVGGTSANRGYAQFNGKCNIKILDPRRFFVCFNAGWVQMLATVQPQQQAGLTAYTLDKQVETWVCTNIRDAVKPSIAAITAAPSAAAAGDTGWSFNLASREQARSTAGIAAAAWLSAVGLSCEAFDFDGDPKVGSMPCQECRSTSSPTAYGIYRRTMSLLVIRYSAKKEGSFCTKCAAKISAQYNLVMLACGWWGYIGLFLTPFYLVMNCFNFCRGAINNGRAKPAVSTSE